MIKEAIKKVLQNENLDAETAEKVMDEIMNGQADDIEISSYLTALRMKGETIDEITASAKGMRSACKHLLHNMDVLEIIGTGGDEAFTFKQYIQHCSGFMFSSRGTGSKARKSFGFEQMRSCRHT